MFLKSEISLLMYPNLSIDVTDKSTAQLIDAILQEYSVWVRVDDLSLGDHVGRKEYIG